jgi:hypothetical protein
MGRVCAKQLGDLGHLRRRQRPRRKAAAFCSTCATVWVPGMGTVRERGGTVGHSLFDQPAPQLFGSFVVCRDGLR